MTAPIEAYLGAGMASEPKEFLEKFEDALRSNKEEDPFVMEKFTPTSYPELRPTKKGNEKYHAPKGMNGISAKAVDQEYSAYSLFELAEPPYNLVKLARVAEKSTPHYAAVAAKVSNITELGHDFVESDKAKDKISTLKGADKKKALERMRKSKRTLRRWVNSLNDDDSIDETLQKVATDYYYTGNGYIEVGRTANGAVGYLGHVAATTMRVRKARDGFVQIVGDKVTYFRNFGDLETPDPFDKDQNPSEILHIKNYSPFSGFYGVPEIVVAMMAVAGTELATRYNLDYFHNKATPRYVIVLKGGNMSDAGQRRVMEFFETGIKGSHHRSLFVPLPADTSDSKVSFEMKPVESGVQEASFEKYIKMNNNTILMAHRVPASKIGLAEGVSLAVARDADKTFKEQVIRPMQSKFERKVNRVLSTYTDMFEFKLNELSLSDEDTQSKIDERRIRNKIQTPNEIRLRDGLPAVEGGDKMVDLTARGAADARANTMQNRTRDAERSAGATDTDGEGRNAKGEGRTVE